LRVKLIGPQPVARQLRKPWGHVTDLQAGDVLLHTADTGRLTLWRVARVDNNGSSAAPIMQQLDWAGSMAPDNATLSELPPLPNFRVRSKPVTCWRVDKWQRRDPDWFASGFTLYDRTPPRSEDEHVPARGWTEWQSMHDQLREGAESIWPAVTQRERA
jgi:hypothetical protein